MGAMFFQGAHAPRGSDGIMAVTYTNRKGMTLSTSLRFPE